MAPNRCSRNAGYLLFHIDDTKKAEQIHEKYRKKENDQFFDNLTVIELKPAFRPDFIPLSTELSTGFVDNALLRTVTP
jgi:hypothetical protein